MDEGGVASGLTPLGFAESTLPQGRGIALAILLLLAACSKAPTVIDGSSPEAFEQTTEQARRDLPIKDRLIFDAALHNPGGFRYAERDMEAVAREAYHGMTAADVVADAKMRGVE